VRDQIVDLSLLTSGNSSSDMTVCKTSVFLGFVIFLKYCCGNKMSVTSQNAYYAGKCWLYVLRFCLLFFLHFIFLFLFILYFVYDSIINK